MPASPSPTSALHEPARDTPIIAEADVCVLGGSCTGVFAAIRAARLGAKVVLVEQAGSFGGVATISQVNVWHTPLNTTYEHPILAGLTTELIDRLDARGCVTHRPNSPHWAWAFNPAEMQIELDQLVQEAGVTPMLHTPFVAPHVEDGRLVAAIVENKSGRGAIRARYFIDATGDGDLCHRLGVPTFTAQHMQPATTTALLSGWETLGEFNLGAALLEHGPEFGLPLGFVWGAGIPGSDMHMLAGTRVYGANCADAAGFTHAEMEGRRQVRGILDLVAKYAPHAKLTLQSLPARIGIRESRHIHSQHQLTGEEVLHGKRFDDAIANGSYRVDVHHHDKPGITLKYLDGTQEYCCPGQPTEASRWRPEQGEDPTFYQIPYRSLLPQGGFGNVIAAGRMIDADEQAHAAIRVMVNMNQVGEAAGVAAVLAMKQDASFASVRPAELRGTLAEGGSVVL